jgi:UPF0271 protein
LEPKDIKLIILDTSALLSGFDPFSSDEKLYSVPKVSEELSKKVPSDSVIQIRFETSIERKRIILKEPDIQFIKTAIESSKNIGDTNLSETDLQLLGLALEQKNAGYAPIIVTDDYSLQNMASQLRIKYSSTVTLGIQSRISWILYCPACYREYLPSYEYEPCEVCGTRLKRKPIKKRSTNT